MSNIENLLEVMKRLRDPETGCPWDVEQDFSSIAPYTIEEAYEVADAIRRNDMHGLRDELGDLLLQVVFHARMAEEAGHFDFNDVAETISEKMLRRHPHVFEGADREHGSWERIKQLERSNHEDTSSMAGIAHALPALKRAQKLGKRASHVGFDWPDRDGVRDKIREELEELEDAVGTRSEAQIEEEFGDLLFAVVNLARHLGVDAEHALTGANHKFEQRFRAMERSIVESGRSLAELPLADLEVAWRAAKRSLNGS